MKPFFYTTLNTHTFYLLYIDCKIIENITMTTRKKEMKDEKSQNLLDVVFNEKKKTYKKIYIIYLYYVSLLE